MITEKIKFEDIERSNKQSMFKDLKKGDLFLPYNPKYSHTFVWMKLSATMCINVSNHTVDELGWRRPTDKNKKVEIVKPK